MIKQKKIGFFGGSFNPPTVAHIGLAKMILEECSLDEIYFVPVGNYYGKKGLIDIKHRINMLNLAIQGEPKLKIEDIESEYNYKLYAIDVFELLQKKYKNDDIYFIMGSDNYNKMSSWKAYDKLKNDYKYIVVNREKNEKNEKNEKIIFLENAIFEKISSTSVRAELKEKGESKNLANTGVQQYIEDNETYERY